jgi:hypothetical protein
MGIVVGGEFEDHGNTIEYTVGEVRAYELLSGNRVRLYLTEERGSAHVLAYTVVVPGSALDCMGRLCIEIANKLRVFPQWAKERTRALAN